METKMDDLSLEVLHKLYTEELMTETEIGRLYGVSQSKVGRLRAKWNIPTLLKSDRLGLPLTLTQRQKSILVGSMLGDGRLFRTGVCTAAYSEHHSAKQKDYLKWKEEEWGPFVTRISDVCHNGHKGSVLATHAARILHPYWNVFYPNGVGDKVFYLMEVSWVDPLALAVWFMDDGSRTESYARFSISNDEKSQKTQLKIFRNLGIKASLYTSDGDPCIHVGDRTNFSHFVDLVAPYIVPSMAYKLDVKPRKAGAAPRDTITLDRLKDLTTRDLSLQEIARILRVSHSSLTRHMRKLGFSPRRAGRPKESAKSDYDPETAQSLIESLSPDSGEFVTQTISILRRTRLPEIVLSEEQVAHDLKLLVESRTRVEGGTIVGSTKGGSRFCGKFFPYLLDARYRNLPSVREAWYNAGYLRKAISFQIKVGDPVTPIRVFRALRVVVRAPTNFRPCFAKALVEAYCPVGGTVLDPCAGYGGRALGTLVSGRRYVGVDPHPNSKKAFSDIQKALGGSLDFHQCPFEDVDLGELEVDMVLTSPPYFSVERYSDDTNQSWVRYKTWTAWLNQFLSPLVSKCEKHLRNGGVFCVNTKTIRMGRQTYPIGKELTRLAIEQGFRSDSVLQLPIGRVGKYPQFESIYVFRKP